MVVKPARKPVKLQEENPAGKFREKYAEESVFTEKNSAT